MGMRRYLFPMVFALSLVGFESNPPGAGGTDQPDDQILAALTKNQYDILTEGRRFLLNEANKNDFFLLGELHGDNEIPALLRSLWPEMWKLGYHQIAAELSPWAAHELEFVPVGKDPNIRGLWTKQEASDAHAFADSNTTVIWGCDMEEEQPQRMIRELARLNPSDSDLKRMVGLTKDGYTRKMAPRLLELAEASNGSTDGRPNDVSLRENLLATLEIEKNRLNPETKMDAQEKRERLMKTQFLEHLRRSSGSGTTSKVLLRFGRNHLHRGYDARGISTLGNFIAEFAISQDKRIFNVGAFGARGRASLLGETWNADERQDELAFASLARKAKYSATIFDLRPIRALLHRIPPEERSALVTNLIYWADSYDALICYKQVTPLNR
jgi:hypothetical protein